MPGPKARQLDLPLNFRRSSADVSQASIALGANSVSYTVRRSPRRRRGSFTLAIDERGLRISVPRDASQRWIDSVLRKHEVWIARKLTEWQARRAPVPCWGDGATLMHLGAPLRLTLVPVQTAPANDDGRLLINVSYPWRPADLAKGVAAWLRGEAVACFRARVAHYAPQLRVVPREVRISEARTRWGSCHPAGNIRLNWRLIQMPLRLVDYVVVHELAHLREMNHSQRFWRTVAAIIPDYAARRKEIRDEAHRYLLV